MNTTDPYKAYQKLEFPRNYGKLRGKRHIYGCSCCWKFPLPAMKNYPRYKAKNKIKHDDRNEFQYFR